MYASKGKLKANISFIDLFSESNLNEKENVILVQKIAQIKGLPSECLCKIVDLIGSTKLKTEVKRTLIKCIIPKDTIPQNCLMKMTSYLADFKLDCNIKVEILKVIIAARPFMENSDLQNFCLYEAFLILLKYEVLRPYVLYVLYSFSTKEHVTSARINYVNKMLDKKDPQTWVTFILSLYSRLQPELVGEVLPEFKPDYDNVLERYPVLIEDMNSLCVHVSSQVESDIHESLDSYYFEVKKEEEHKSVENNSEEIVSIPGSVVEEAFVENSSTFSSFDQVERNLRRVKDSSIQNILKSELRRLLFTSDIGLQVQLSYFDYMLTSLSCTLNFDSVLPVMLDVLREVQNPVIPVSKIMELIIDWDGSSNFHSVLEILSYQEICCFGKISNGMIHLREIIKTAPVVRKCHFLATLSKMYQNWALIELSRCGRVLCEGNCPRSSKDVLEPSGNRFHSSIDELYELGGYIDTVCDQYVSENDFHPFILNQVLILYKRISYTRKRNTDLILHLPTPTVFTSALMSSSSLTLENLCILMLHFLTDVYSQAKENHSEHGLAKKCFTMCFFDVGNLLWKIKEYEPNDITYVSQTRVFKKLKKVYPNFKDYFVLYSHPALLLKTMKFFKEIEVSHLPSSVKNIPEVSKNFFAYLSEDENFKYFTYVMKCFYQRYPVKD